MNQSLLVGFLKFKSLNAILKQVLGIILVKVTEMHAI